ncbi:hypothetical protein BDU57DRAFT_447504 [Ampelomyces quisqualis]|uniref:Uncharacterized protein n=1 Tax=Ampelomyces quisqualis TaxID=50730 RepID=A0A6A5QQY2_AMPQU|nr:hypothetical protein BDU57DRAFT_447504 [Ampelomyces quisqualis]
MFVPRALRLKGVRETRRQKPSKPPPADHSESSRDDALVDAMQGISTDSPKEEHIDPAAVSRGPRFTVKPVTSEYLAQLVAGVELIFSDYAHHEEVRAAWLQERYRTVDGGGTFVHLTAILENPHVSTLKPEPTQVLLQQALREHPSHSLELASNGYHVRRNPSSYPPKFLPENSFAKVNDDGLTFWDQRTIYVEPHLRNLCQSPAKVAHWLKAHGQLKTKWMPIQAVHMLYNSCAFVVLSGSVMHADVWSKWRAADKPNDWKIMTKVEHTKRTAEYVAILEKRNPRSMRKAKPDDANIPAIAKPAALAMDVEVTPGYTECIVRPKNKRKRNRRKGDKETHVVEDQTNDSNPKAVEAHEHEPCSKRRA